MGKSKQVVFTDKAVKPVGPYSQAVRAGDFLFISGTVPVDPVTDQVVARDIAVQTRQVFDSIKAILMSGGATMDDLVKATIHLHNARDWRPLHDLNRTYFTNSLPARLAFECKPPLH